MAIPDIENVTLAEIRKGDGAQRYTFPFVDGMDERWRPPMNVIWLCGWNRADNVKVGLTGKMVWRTGHNYGLYFFVRD